MKILLIKNQNANSEGPNQVGPNQVFCRQPAGNEGLHIAEMFRLDKRVRAAANHRKTQNYLRDLVLGT